MARGKPAVALVGAGKLAGSLVPALADAGYRIAEIVTRERAQSIKQARALSRRVGARAATWATAALDAEVVWFTVPDGQIRATAEALARRLRASGARGPRSRASAGKSAAARPFAVKFAFHSSGALRSEELESLAKFSVAVASVHPLMTFVAKSEPSLAGVPFAVEGDRAAVRAARAIVRELGGESFVLAARRKAAYHAWATMTSPLLVAYLVTLEEAARAAGLRREAARRMSLPIVRQTLENYARLGPADAFSGPFIRGDAETVAKHLALLRPKSKTRAVYRALARAALAGLPVRNRARLWRLLKD